MQAILIPGGGMRALYTAFAMEWLYERGKFDPSQNKCPIIGDSAGGLIAYFLAIGYKPNEIADIFLTTDFAKILTPWYKRIIPWKEQILASVKAPIPLDPLMKWIDTEHPCPRPEMLDRLFITAWNDEYNTAVVPCNKIPEWAVDIDNDDLHWQPNAYNMYSPGYWITCGMTLPCFMAPYGHYYWIDGGVGEHPLISPLPKDTQITYFGLSPELLTPRHPVLKNFVENSSLAKSLLDKIPILGGVKEFMSTSVKDTIGRFSRIYNIKAKKYQDVLLAEYPNVKNYDTGLMEIDTVDLGMSFGEKQKHRQKTRLMAARLFDLP